VQVMSSTTVVLLAYLLVKESVWGELVEPRLEKMERRGPLAARRNGEVDEGRGARGVV
jgi:hypothetical protein